MRLKSGIIHIKMWNIQKNIPHISHGCAFVLHNTSGNTGKMCISESTGAKGREVGPKMKTDGRIQSPRPTQGTNWALQASLLNIDTPTPFRNPLEQVDVTNGMVWSLAPSKGNSKACPSLGNERDKKQKWNSQPPFCTLLGRVDWLQAAFGSQGSSDPG